MPCTCFEAQLVLLLPFIVIEGSDRHRYDWRSWLFFKWISITVGGERVAWRVFIWPVWSLLHTACTKWTDKTFFKKCNDWTNHKRNSRDNWFVLKTSSFQFWISGKHAKLWHQYDKASVRFRQQDKWLKNWLSWLKVEVRVETMLGGMQQNNMTMYEKKCEKSSNMRPSKTNQHSEGMIGFLTWTANRGSHLNTRENWVWQRQKLKTAHWHTHRVYSQIYLHRLLLQIYS